MATVIPLHPKHSSNRVGVADITPQPDESCAGILGELPEFHRAVADDTRRLFWLCMLFGALAALGCLAAYSLRYPATRAWLASAGL